TDPPEVIRPEILCQRIANTDGAINVAAWRACADAGGTMDGLRRELVTCFGCEADGQHATPMGGAPLPDRRGRLEVVTAAGTTEEARREIGPLLDRLKARAEGWYPTGPGGALADIFRRRPNAEPLTGMKVAEACQGLADLTLARRVVHPGDPLLD